MAFLCLAVYILAFPALARPQARYTETPRTITTGPASNGFYELLPPGYDPNGSKTYPLMVFLHGLGEVGNGASDLGAVLANGPPRLIHAGTFPTSFTSGGKSYSFIVIAPQFNTWPAGSDADLVVQYAISHYKVDANMVYVTGLSMGGGVAWDYAADPDADFRAAAVMVVSGAKTLGPEGAESIAKVNLPIYATHNLDDPTVASSNTTITVNLINSVTNPAIKIKAIDTIFAVSGHDAWTKTYDPAFVNPRIGNLNVYQWMLQYSRNSVILPVTLSAYSATLSADQSQVAINWATTSEENNKYFILQRSADGLSFSNLDTIAATNEASGHDYTYNDQSPVAGNNFYRLTQVDLDGKTTDFRVLSVNVSRQPGISFRLGPNPADNTLHLQFVYPGESTLGVSLSDVQGRILRSWTFQKEGAVWDQTLDVSSLPAGNYFIRLKSGTYNASRQFVKK